jgi:CYTH domain-containing protein
MGDSNPITMAHEPVEICLQNRILRQDIIPYGEHNFEVDVFHGRHEGLIIAEIELLMNGRILVPDWLGEEVTGKTSTIIPIDLRICQRVFE